jgi:hypothetical protein
VQKARGLTLGFLYAVTSPTPQPALFVFALAFWHDLTVEGESLGKEDCMLLYQMHYTMMLTIFKLISYCTGALSLPIFLPPPAHQPSSFFSLRPISVSSSH